MTRVRFLLKIGCVYIWTVTLCLFSACAVEESADKPPEKPSRDDPYKATRERMVRKDIAGSSWGRTGVKDKAVLEAMRTVPRHEFVPGHYQRRAYSDGPLPIGYGQTISQPYIVAIMTELLGVDEDDIALEIGTGSGYQAAVLAEIVKKVHSIEIIKKLGEEATKRLKSLGYDKVDVKIGDGYFGWAKHGPFDAIIVTAAASHIPPPLVEQLKPGGKMIIPVGQPFQVQHLMLLEKGKDGSVVKRNIMPVRFVPFTRGKKKE